MKMRGFMGIPAYARSVRLGFYLYYSGEIRRPENDRPGRSRSALMPFLDALHDNLGVRSAVSHQPAASTRAAILMLGFR
jgi:hypothetical protein